MPKAKSRKSAASKSAKRAKPDAPMLTEAERRVVMIQYEKENDPEGADALVVEYLKFMQLKMREGEKGSDEKKCCAPSTRIDEMWHAHILATRAYFAFCARHHRREYLHHDPTLTDVPARYRATWARYSELFGHAPKDRSIWPPPREEEEEEESDECGDPGCG